ncbi:phosphatidylinositol-3-phosphatase SAC1 [Anopheles cruzii]|uniref:phosphatidylinositol-3-phosphatase SAC1 n=1 Tax=Anopheles cruzii TaxID=68878 RepID=UPI0022EC6F30|nr:phosphatidylinositol-3-phosphatase SAC1 [Anopheles cruzii]
MAVPVYSAMKLYISADKFYIEPCGENVNEYMVIDRASAIAEVQEKEALSYPPDCEPRMIYGILGMLELPSCMYLCVIMDKAAAGILEGHEIHRLTSYAMVSLRTGGVLEEHQDSTCMKLVLQVLNTPFFYFSYSSDLTHTLQRARKVTGTSLYERADTRFVWNYALLDGWYRSDMYRYCVPLLHGFISIHDIQVSYKNVCFVLISRRSRERAGTRLFTRGINSNGEVANYVETEQIIACGVDRVSFVQTRGSIPLFWQQMPNLRYKPAPKLLNDVDHLTPYSKHIDDQLARYGRQILINLIDQNGAESELERAFRAMVKTHGNPNVRYEAFDFHRECRGMRYDRISSLIARVAKEQDELGVFHHQVDAEGLVLSKQKGVFRTNCIDCLDRTNLFQSVLAQRSLQQTLEKLDIVRYIEPTSALATIFKAVWADNADLISLQYAGTRALKTDFTRTGKRTLAGAYKDGRNSLRRYIKNNFTDGRRQDGIDFLLGTYREPDTGAVFPVMQPYNPKIIILICLFVITFAGTFMLLVFPQEYTVAITLCIMACLTMALLLFYYLYKNRSAMIVWPQLERLKEQ